MSNDTARDIVPLAGDRAVLMFNLEQLRGTIQEKVLSEKATIEILDVSNNQIIVPSDQEEEQLPQLQDLTNESLSSFDGDLLELLESCPQGQALLNNHSKSGLLDHKARKRLCHLIIEEELKNDPQRMVTSSRLKSLATQIINIFKKENPSTYYIPYVSYGNGRKRLAKGKLYDCLNNKRRHLREIGVIPQNKRRATTDQTGCPELTSKAGSEPSTIAGPSSALTKHLPLGDNDHQLNTEKEAVLESLLWLKNNSSPWEKVEEHWNKTRKYRLLQLKQSTVTIFSYLKEYPALKKPSGYLLIASDFDVSYPTVSNKLEESLPKYKKLIYELAKEHYNKSRDQTEKDELKKYLNCEEGDEDISNLGCLLCLPFLLPTTNLKKKEKGIWKPSKSECLESFIAVVATDSLLQGTVTNRRVKLESLGVSMQPFIIAVGAVDKDIKSYFIVVNDVFYKLNSSMLAVDTCFKCIMQLNAQYPAESTIVWTFIQQAFYSMVTPYDKKYNAVAGLLSDLGIKDRKENTTKQLLKHITVIHGTDSYSKFKCAQPNCSRTFQLKNSFRKHLLLHESNLVQQSAPTSSNIVLESRTDQFTGNDTQCPLPSSNSPSTSLPEPFHSTTSTIPIYTKPEHATSPVNFLANLYSNALIPRNVIQYVVDGVSSLISTNISFSISKILDQSSIDEVTKRRVHNVLQNPFPCLETEFKRLKYFESHHWYIPPIEVVIGERLEDRRQAGTLCVQPVTSCEQFVPIREVLKGFFSIPNLLTETINYLRSLQSNNSLLINFVQGSVWMSKHSRDSDRIVLPLVLFFDDYETGNVLGSHSGQHKVGAVYLSVACLPSHYLSSLQHIFLCLLFHSADRTTFGNSVVFEPVINEINHLKREGIDFQLPDFSGKVYFELGLIIGDNLGLHQITGFFESFSAQFPCRICLANKQEIQTMVFEDKNKIRDSNSYKHIIDQGNYLDFGVKEPTIWGSVEGFDIFNGTGVDVMHDIFEGVANYLMSFLINYYVFDFKLFSLQVFNDRLFGFDFGADKDSKPCALSLDRLKQGSVKQSASEMLVLIRHFGLLVGDLIPSDEPTWSMYLLFRQILDIIMCRTSSNEQNFLLKTLISEFNSAYLNLTHSSLKPKFHFLLHYPMMAEKFGPLINLWCMRYEAKHRLSKMYARATCNRRNITKSLAIKHQLQLVNVLSSSSMKPIISIGKKSKTVQSVQDSIFSYLSVHNDNEHSLHKVTWANVKGTLYTRKSVLSVGLTNCKVLEFGLVNDIFLLDDSYVVFHFQHYKNLGFCDHVHAYEVQLTNEFSYIVQEKLVSYIPNNINTVSSGKMYITIRDPM